MGLFISNNKNVELTNGEEKFLDALKKMYLGTASDVIIYVQSVISKKRPDFIIIDSKNGISILEVKDWSEEYIKEVNKRKVTLLDGECDNPNMQVNGYKNILCSGIFSRNFDIDSDDISTIVVFTNMLESIREDDKYRCLFSNSVKYLFKSDLINLDINKIFNNNCGGYSGEDCKKIRVALFPELEIINIEEDIVNISDIKVLDYEQEEFAKKILIGKY